MTPLDQMSREELEDELAWRRSEMGEGILASEIMALREVFGLEPQQAHALLILYRAKGRPITRVALLDQLPARRSRDEDTIGKHILTIVCNIRKRLGADAIKTAGDGHYRYSIPMGSEARMRVAAALATIERGK